MLWSIIHIKQNETPCPMRNHRTTPATSGLPWAPWSFGRALECESPLPWGRVQPIRSSLVKVKCEILMDVKWMYVYCFTVTYSILMFGLAVSTFFWRQSVSWSKLFIFEMRHKAHHGTPIGTPRTPSFNKSELRRCAVWMVCPGAASAFFLCPGHAGFTWTACYAVFLCESAFGTSFCPESSLVRFRFDIR